MTIVVGYLKTDEGEAALDRAIDEARLRADRVIVVHSMRGGERDERDRVIAYREVLDAIRARLAAEGVDGDVRELVRGRSPDEDVLDAAEESGANLIVIGLRRRSPVGKLVLGSNAQTILLNAECPVLTVKAGQGRSAG